MKTAHLLAALGFAGVLLSGCTTNPSVPGNSASLDLRPASERPVTSDNQSRAKIHTDLGMAYVTAQRVGVALDEVRTALAYDDTYAPAHHLHALVFMALNDATSARGAFARADALAPGDPEINNSYGWFLCVQGEVDEGVRMLEQSARNPYYTTPTRPMTNAGLCRMGQGQLEAAEAYFRRAMTLDANNIQAVLNLAAIAYRRNNPEAAHVYLNTVHQKSRSTAESLWLGVRVERARNDKETEASYASQLKSRFPTSPEYQKLIEGKYE
ncbi:MAG TPA: type IV pilus biogenesis/stability protein PilW [Denitromonas sp.]|uniref:type IV pilus biogenesis/stability protein PilW n=1 Tax=Denitromonas sp. TaxID=2734609 RepID=UPI001D6EE94C|nr:type IV pilus biogenesis/stability protein PilW [Rhodocyclaceae bacterium]MCP5221126.1 type IV pilus biogenesis/stability protein PilW [Zoogloeaceae bacterium]HQU88382.1 type IV pilus biogenesis/stability protein PilW [Denitromonas sp.]HQV14612.1 type IV pilus biogenesis/stability protein PilW [Denitromonas sp.]